MLRLLTASAKKGEGIFATRAATYICLVLAAILAASVHKLRTQSIFACQATLYSSDLYLAYCNGTRYGDFEHGAFWFDLEPSAETFARSADVLFLGNSRLQFAFSTGATVDWFLRTSARYYLLGFSYYENVVFAEPLIHRIRPKASVYVINIDDFFDRWETPPANEVMHDPEGRSRYEAKHFWQRVHENVCKMFLFLCSDDFSIFRSRETGAYTAQLGKDKQAPVSYDRMISQDVVNRYSAVGSDFLSTLPVDRKCVILTMVPTQETKIGNANAVAAALGQELIAPEISQLHTLDGSHLDQPSAQRWSQAFFRAASTRIQSCLERADATQSSR